MKNKKKASRAKKAAAAATRNTNLSPRQEVEPELRMPAWLSAFVEQFLRLPRMPAMPAWLSAFVQRFQLVPVVVVVQEVPARKKPGGFQAKMYGFSRRAPQRLLGPKNQHLGTLIRVLVSHSSLQRMPKLLILMSRRLVMLIISALEPRVNLGGIFVPFAILRIPNQRK